MSTSNTDLKQNLLPQRTHDYYSKVDAYNDVILTALEAAGLDLSKTKLVVLFACKIELGELHKQSPDESGLDIGSLGEPNLVSSFYHHPHQH